VLESNFKSLPLGAPGYVEIGYNLALVKNNAGLVKEGAALLRHIIEVAPQLCQASLMLGRTHLQMGDHIVAENILRRATNYSPQCAHAYALLGTAVGMQSIKRGL